MMAKKTNLKLVRHKGARILVTPIKKVPANVGRCVWREGTHICDLVRKTKTKTLDHKRHHDCLNCLRCTGGRVHEILCACLKRD